MKIHKNTIPLFNIKHDYFENSFFPSTITEWNNLDPNIKNPESLTFFNKRILAFTGSFASLTFHCHSAKGLKVIARLRLELHHL